MDGSAPVGDFTLLFKGKAIAERYDASTSLDKNLLVGIFSVRRSWTHWTVDLVYFPLLSFDRDFDDRTLTLHNFVLGGGRRLGKTAGGSTIDFLPRITRTFGNPHDFSATEARLDFKLETTVAEKAVTLTLTPGIRGKIYDDFFEAQTGESRKDLTLVVDTMAKWTPKGWKSVTLKGGFTFTENSSSVNALSFSRFDALPSITIVVSDLF